MKLPSLETLANEWNTLKKPFCRYTAAQLALNATVIASQTGDLGTTGSDTLTNLPFIAVVNLGYAKSVDCLVKTLGKGGRLGANVFSLSVSGAFYTYGLLTNDSDPALPATVAGIIGIYLTNKQVTELQTINHPVYASDLSD